MNSDARDTREYMEVGCLCIVTKRVPLAGKDESDEDAATRYILSCKCSRHPDGTNSGQYDGALEVVMRKEWKDGLKRKAALAAG